MTREAKHWAAFAIAFALLWALASGLVIRELVWDVAPVVADDPDQSLGVGPPAFFLSVALLLPFTVAFAVAALGRFTFLSFVRLWRWSRKR